MTPSLAEHDPVDPSREDATADHSVTATTNAFAERAPESSIADSKPLDPSSADAGASPGAAIRDAAIRGAATSDAATNDAEDAVSEDGEARRTIKRYSNRKLYDTRQSRYVTLLQIAEMVRAGEDVQIIDNATKEDKTDVTLALIISEELKARPRAIPLATLKALIRHRGGKLLTQLRESPIGRLMPREEDGSEHEPLSERELSEGPPVHHAANAEELHVNKDQPGGLRRTLEQWQHTIDDRIRAVVPHFSTIQELQGEVQQLSKRLEELEKRLASPRE